LEYEESVAESSCDDGIVEALLAGASLRSVMVPDSSIPTNRPTHVETYDFPHVVAKDGWFWAFSGTAHCLHSYGEGVLATVQFCYTNQAPFFCSVTPSLEMGILMSRRRYREHRWLLRPAGRPIWDSEDQRDPRPVREAIERGSLLWVAMRDSEEVWNFHPVDLPMFEVEEGRFVLKTAVDAYPIFFRSPRETRELYRSQQAYFDHMPHDNNDGTMGAKMSFFSTFYSLSSDGSYYNYYDIPRGTTQRYRRLRVFEEAGPFPGVPADSGETRNETRGGPK